MMEYYSALKKWIPFAATWMDLDIIILSEVSQTDKGQIPYDIIYMWNLKKWYNQTSLETDLQTQKTSPSSPKETGGGRCDKLGGWD